MQQSYTRLANSQVYDPYKNRFTEIGFNVSMMPVFCDVEYIFYNDKAKNDFEFRESTTKLDPVLSYGFTGGSSIPLAKFGKESALHLSVNFMINYSKGTISASKFKRASKDNATFEEEFKFYRWYVPIGLDYKIGAEALSDKYVKYMYSFGGGIAPKITTYSILGGFGAPVVSPYVKVEAGYFLGIAFKIRATYFFGEQLWDYSDVLSTTGTDLRAYALSSQGDFAISLILMPNSYTWDN